MPRQSGYCVELAQSICQQIAEGKSLRSICEAEDMPAAATICLWLTKHPEFAEQYAHAREAQADHMAEEILEISDDARNDWMERQSEAEKGAGVNNGWVLNGEHVQRSRLRVDARKWLAAKMAPKKYGDRLGGDATAQLNVAFTVNATPVSRIAAEVVELAGQRTDVALSHNGANGFVLPAPLPPEKDGHGQ